MDEGIIKAIEAITKRGNDAEVRRKGDGYIVLEVKKTIKYSRGTAVFIQSIAATNCGRRKGR